jgi:LuxR family maltose regulon positive regulatory protein
LLDQIGRTRVTLLTALPGFGKTVTARQWIDRADTPTGWVSLELLDGEPGLFWSYFLDAVRRVRGDVDDEPGELLAERGPEDPLFLDALVAQLRTGARIAIVLDGVTDRLDDLVLNGLVHLVERTGDVLDLVVTARSMPALPLARWRTAGWLTELRDTELRLTDDEAVAAAREIDSEATTAQVLALHRRLDGWPIGLHMALLSDHHDVATPTSQRSYRAESDRVLADYLVSGVLSSMPPRDRDVVLTLSVLRWFDPATCRELAGIDADEVVSRLLSHGTFLTVVDRQTGVMRFHALFRELMELHLSVTDPARRVDLHQRAARLLQSRNDLPGAYHHYAAIGDRAAGRALLVEPAMTHVVEGDHEALRREAHRLPPTSDVESRELASDLAVIALYAQGPRAARHWCDHAASIAERAGGGADGQDDDFAFRLHARRGVVALLEADLETASAHVDRCRRLLADTQSTGSFEEQFPVFAARTMLALRREHDSAFWIDRARRITSPALVANVTVPTLRSWQAWLFGDLRAATSLSDDALAWMHDHVRSPNHLTFDTLITAGWCRIGIGDLDGAADLSRTAIEHAAQLEGAWQHLQAGYLAAQLAVLTREPARALQIIDDLRSGISFDACHPYSDRIVAIEAEARAQRDLSISDDLLLTERSLVGARAQLLHATYAEDAETLDVLLAERDTWILPDSLQAELLLVTGRHDAAARGELVRLVSRCADTGWISPFLGLPDASLEQVLSLPLDDLHPELAHRLAARSLDQVEEPLPARDVVITSREASLLPLLQTHMSYSEIGQQLFLSVNTVKSNLQRLYRKLGAHTRSEAVERARDLGLLE